jgi:hypothetical protein
MMMMNLPVILYKCDNWSLNIREERRLLMSVNRVLKRMFGNRGKQCQKAVENYTMV